VPGYSVSDSLFAPCEYFSALAVSYLSDFLVIAQLHFRWQDMSLAERVLRAHNRLLALMPLTSVCTETKCSLRHFMVVGKCEIR